MSGPLEKPDAAVREKCRMPLCPAHGEPLPGYGFFVCGKCLAAFTRAYAQGLALRRRYLRHWVN